MSVSPVSSKSSSVGKIPESKFSTIGVGDTIRVGVLLIEGNKERTQFFEGTVIAIKKREGRRILRVRKLSQFPPPRLASITTRWQCAASCPDRTR